MGSQERKVIDYGNGSGILMALGRDQYLVVSPVLYFQEEVNAVQGDVIRAPDAMRWSTPRDLDEATVAMCAEAERIRDARTASLKAAALVTAEPEPTLRQRLGRAWRAFTA
jgi:hypothetical protein